MNIEATLARLSAIESIRLMKARYFRFLDEAMWDDYQALYTDDAVMDLSEVLPPGTPAEHLTLTSSAAIRAQVSTLMTGAIMLHNGYTHELEILSATEATGIWSMEDRVIYPESVPCPFPHRETHYYGRYHERYRLENGTWRIAYLKLTRAYEEH
jgi:hypothetical protein